jgi:hypothetical protein
VFNPLSSALGRGYGAWSTASISSAVVEPAPALVIASASPTEYGAHTTLPSAWIDASLR